MEVTFFSGGEPTALPARRALAAHIRRHVRAELYDASGAALADGIAIYALSDPADLGVLRYVGQSGSPRRRFLQHLHSARLWLAAEQPWWIKNPPLRPLYDWIRAIYREGLRLPTMVVWEWRDEAASARRAERARIGEALARGDPLLNIEAERSGWRS